MLFNHSAHGLSLCFMLFNHSSTFASPSAGAAAAISTSAAFASAGADSPFEWAWYPKTAHPIRAKKAMTAKMTVAATSPPAFSGFLANSSRELARPFLTRAGVYPLRSWIFLQLPFAASPAVPSSSLALKASR